MEFFMNRKAEKVKIVIIGGGLSGLSLGYLLAEHNIPVVLIEKEDYPRHKVCGEFISRESMDFLTRTGVIHKKDEFPHIDQFELVFPNGKIHTCKLDPGGIGISRFTLDHRLFQLAMEKGVNIITNDKVNTLKRKEKDGFLVGLKSGKQFSADVVVIANGRNAGSLYPVKKEQEDRLSWFGVKYHIDLPMSRELIRIMMFEGGYAGVSAVENGRYCFCYLAKTKNFKKFKGNIAAFENEIVRKNPEIDRLLNQATMIEGPFTTSGFHFGYHGVVDNGLLFCGDAGGFIPPLTGNGMSLAFRNAVVLAPLLNDFFNKKGNWEDLKSQYEKYGENYLKKRISSGLYLQNLALDPGSFVQRILSGSMTVFPFILKMLSNKAKGNSF